MESIKKHLSEGFNLLCAISVKGDDVDVMAMAKQELRTAYALIEKAEKAEVKQDG